jgi:phage tail sheath protein FI
MVIPGDSGIPSTVHETFWAPASNYCQHRRAFLLIDPPASWVKNKRPEVKNNTSLVTALRNTVAKQNSAVFFFRLVYNAGGLLKTIGPSGIIAGLMSRFDSTRGVWKAPAGIEADLRSVLDLEINLTDAENGVLNKQAVNCSRIFPSGIVNWGARTIDGFDDQGSEWKYIPIRRLALFLEESLYRGTKWVVFEPNDEPLWAKIRLNLNAFMMGLFRQGAFQGSTPDKAFFLKCHTETRRTTNLHRWAEAGFAPLKPPSL